MLKRKSKYFTTGLTKVNSSSLLVLDVAMIEGLWCLSPTNLQRSSNFTNLGFHPAESNHPLDFF